MKSIDVKIPGSSQRSYTIKIGTGLLETIITNIGQAYPKHALFLVTDSNLVKAGHADNLLGTGKTAGRYVIEPAGEISKHLGTIGNIVEQMDKSGLGRDTVVLALGGGVVGDIAGFAASIFKRGIPVVQIPTTTVSQADSAIGGKTGVDSSISKNAFGTFWNPIAVFIDVATLATLDERQFRAGLVESVKHALIADEQYFEYLEKNLDMILSRQPAVLEEIAARNCDIKAAVVEKDPYENNLRRILNYGHTIGHAVESASNYALLHGEAVAIGIIAAGLIEKNLGLAKADRLSRIETVLNRLMVPTRIPHNIDKGQIFGLLKSDKKAIGRVPRFVLLDSIGHVFAPDGQYAVDVAEQTVKAVLDNL